MLEGRLPNRFPGCDYFASGLWSVCAAPAAPRRVGSIFVAQMFSGRSEQYWRLKCLPPTDCFRVQFSVSRRYDGRARLPAEAGLC